MGRAAYIWRDCLRAEVALQCCDEEGHKEYIIHCMYIVGGATKNWRIDSALQCCDRGSFISGHELL